MLKGRSFIMFIRAVLLNYRLINLDIQLYF
nr:MAG TPA: hypothetical protein [Caudoviricetes sp.]